MGENPSKQENHVGFVLISRLNKSKLSLESRLEVLFMIALSSN
jgi:hypothetical protein